MIDFNIFKNKDYREIEIYHEGINGHTVIEPDNVKDVTVENDMVHIHEHSGDTIFTASRVLMLICRNRVKYVYVKNEETIEVTRKGDDRNE